MHKGSISIYFRFSVFYTIRRISTSLINLRRQFFLISQHRESYKPSKNGAICASSVCTKVLFYLSSVFDRTFVQMLIAPCIVDHSGAKVLCANFIANIILQHHKGSIDRSAGCKATIKTTISNLAKY